MQATRGAAVAASAAPKGSRRTTLLLVTAAVVLVLDVVSKVIVVATMQGHRPVHVLGGVLRIVYTRNSGAAFSIGTGATLLFTGVALVVVVVIVREARRLVSTPWALSLGLLLGGALGNLTDRLFRAPAPLRGHVVDWVQLPHWPVFNLADSAIVVGGALALLLAARGVPLDRLERPGGEAGEPAP
jgi:lipoprotein signal peptidase